MTARQCLMFAPLTALLASSCLQVSGSTASSGSAGEQCFSVAPTKHRPTSTACPTIEYCQQDSECALGDGGKRVCSCSPSGTGSSNGPNYCISGNCLVDADCDCGYCSPSEGTYCIYRVGYVGYYCHTKADTCLDDSDCDAGLCEFNPMVSHWACATNLFCAG